MTTKAERIELFGFDTKEEAKNLFNELREKSPSFYNGFLCCTDRDRYQAQKIILDYLEKMLLKFWDV